MEQVFTFDLVEDTQSVFRKLMDVMARPATRANIKREADGFQEHFGRFLALGCTLLDNETGFYVEKDEVLKKTLADYTLAKAVNYRKADFIFLSDQQNYETVKALFLGAGKGTLQDPQTGATFVISCTDLEGEIEAEFTGPGIPGGIVRRVNIYLYTVLHLRQELDCEYPCGIDLVFVDNSGNLAAFPRLVRVERRGA